MRVRNPNHAPTRAPDVALAKGKLTAYLAALGPDVADATFEQIRDAVPGWKNDRAGDVPSDGVIHQALLDLGHEVTLE